MEIFLSETINSLLPRVLEVFINNLLVLVGALSEISFFLSILFYSFLVQYGEKIRERETNQIIFNIHLTAAMSASSCFLLLSIRCENYRVSPLGRYQLRLGELDIA